MEEKISIKLIILRSIIIFIILIGIGLIIFTSYTNEVEKENHNQELCESKGYEGSINYPRATPMCYKYDENDVKIKEEIRGLK